MDFRSDTVTKPTLAMGQAMLQAVLTDATGDDVMGEDATIIGLEARVAALLGKEAAVFVPTCTMANLLAVGAQCARGEEVLLGTESHIFGALAKHARAPSCVPPRYPLPRPPTPSQSTSRAARRG